MQSNLKLSGDIETDVFSLRNNGPIGSNTSVDSVDTLQPRYRLIDNQLMDPCADYSVECPNIRKYICLDQNPDASFPEKLMLLLCYVENECEQLGKPEEKACIGWVLDGRAFVIRDPTEFVNRILPLAFPKSKLSSFTRKLNRWGFRQLTIGNNNGLDDSLAGKKIFGNNNFRRDDKSRMQVMQNVSTTAGTRRVIASLANRQDDSAKRLVQLVPVEPIIFSR